MSELRGNSYPIERLNPEALQIAKEQNDAEFNRRSSTRIFTVETTEEYPNSIAISYADIGQSLPIEAKDKVKPGTKILVVQKTDEVISPVVGVYALGENLKEISSPPPGASENPTPPPALPMQ